MLDNISVLTLAPVFNVQLLLDGLFIGAIFYQSIPLWMTWGLFVVVCLISMGTMIFMLKWLERVAK